MSILFLFHNNMTVEKYKGLREYFLFLKDDRNSMTTYVFPDY